MRGYNKKLTLLVLAIGICIGCMACGKKNAENTASQKVFKLGKETVYLDEVWIYARTVMDGYEKKYGSQVWGIETADSDGSVRSMEDITRQDVIEDICATKLLVDQADAYQVSLTDAEKTDAVSQAKSFYQNLTDTQISQMGISQETVQKVFEDNVLADKVYNAVMSAGNVEVSDEEARMTTIYDMYFACYKEDDAGNIEAFADADRQSQLALAQEAMRLLDDPENPVDYDTIVSKYGLQYGGSRTLSYAELVSEYGELLVNTLYALENGQHTDVVETEYGYHIIGMVALTDESATAAKKQELLDAKQKEYFEAQLETWLSKTDKNWTYKKAVDQEVYGKIPFGESNSSSEK